jgi:hypothetical protein
MRFLGENEGIRVLDFTANQEEQDRSAINDEISRTRPDNPYDSTVFHIHVLRNSTLMSEVILGELKQPSQTMRWRDVDA